MALKYHKSITDDGGSIGAEIFSGIVDALLPQIKLLDMATGAIIRRKFYISNSSAEDVTISALSMNDFTIFSTILFESSGDAQVVGDLTGGEGDESPITVVIPALGHKSFWVKVEIPISSVTTANFSSTDIKQIL